MHNKGSFSLLLLLLYILKVRWSTWTSKETYHNIPNDTKQLLTCILIPGLYFSLPMTLSLHLYSIAEDFRPSLRPILRSCALLLPTLWTQPIHRARALVEVVHQVTSGHQEVLGFVFFFSPGSDFANGLAPGSALRGDMRRRRRRNPKFLFAILQASNWALQC